MNKEAELLAVILKLREALEDFKIYAQDTGQPLYIYRRITDALSTPHDDSALREIKAGYEAQIKVLRDALEDTFYFLERHSNRWDGVNGKHPNDVAESAREALNQPTDDSALRELLKAERERCAKVADEWQTAIHDPRYQCDCAKAILAMEDQ